MGEGLYRGRITPMLLRKDRPMTASTQFFSSASTRRMVLWGLGAFIALLVAGAVALWVTLGSAVFYEVLAAGIAYCF
jgi:hypothetical protein